MTDSLINTSESIVLSLIAAVVIAALWQACAHYLPWRGVIGQHIGQRRISAYIVGVMGIIAAFSIWDFLAPPRAEGLNAIALVCICVASGIVVALCYALDRYIAERNENAAHRAYRAAHMRRDERDAA